MEEGLELAKPGCCSSAGDSAEGLGGYLSSTRFSSATLGHGRMMRRGC